MQAVGRAYPGRACLFFIASSAISVSGSMWKKYDSVVCVRVKMSLGVLGLERLKAQWHRGIRMLRREKSEYPPES